MSEHNKYIYKLDNGRLPERNKHGVKKTGGRTSYLRRSKNLALRKAALESSCRLLWFCLHSLVNSTQLNRELRTQVPDTSKSAS